ncbi:MAG: hypothetical protein HQL34_01650 [Alphaproteobacteria bacterium]|nr:hypothetical protein [Alphaproteobacteria bacterium]
MKWVRILAVAVAVTGVAGEALAAGTVAARLSSVLFSPMEETGRFEVRLYDDSDANKALKSEIEGRLAAAGYGISANAPLILSFDLRNTVGDGRPDEPTSRLEVRGNSSTAGRDDYSARLKLFSTRTGEEGSPGAAYGGSVRLELAISSRANGRRLWQGWAVADSTGREGGETAAALVGPLVEVIGKTVRGQDVSVVAP